MTDEGTAVEKGENLVRIYPGTGWAATEARDHAAKALCEKIEAYASEDPPPLAAIKELSSAYADLMMFGND